MTKPASTTKKPRKQHTPEFRQEALKLAERIGVAAAARELNLYESQLYNWRSKQQNQLSSSEREQEMSAEIARSGWYVWHQRRHQINRRQRFRLVCDNVVREVFSDAKQRYGAPRLMDELRAQGYQFNVKTVAASLRRQGLRAKASRRFRPVSYRKHGLP
ncbi:IS3 family transposase, partial [Salmonella enterica]